MIRNSIQPLLGDGLHTRLVVNLSRFAAPFSELWLSGRHALDEVFGNCNLKDYPHLQEGIAGLLLEAMNRSFKWTQNPTNSVPFNLAPPIYRNLQSVVMRIYGAETLADQPAIVPPQIPAKPHQDRATARNALKDCSYKYDDQFKLKSLR